MRFHRVLVSISVSTLAVPTFGGSLQYAFQIQPNESGLQANIDVGFATAGTLVGNWNAESNPTGTRTKPGLLGPFGDTENVPVSMTLDAGLVGSPNTRAGGGFGATFDLNNGLMSLSGLSSDLLKSGPESLTAELTLETETFRTRNPTFLYLGGIPITVPVGQVTLSALSAVQVGDAAPGLLTPIAADRYSFVVAPLVQLTGSAEVLGQVFDLPATPLPLPLQGEVVFAGDTALLTAIQPIDFQNTTPVDLTLPETPLALPTFDPNNPANVLLNLALSEISASLAGTLTLSATGEIVPEPGSAGLLLMSVLILAARRR